ncbi:hypothetical protein RQP46_007023 [Phenoliferia psychrophenolica]
MLRLPVELRALLVQLQPVRPPATFRSLSFASSLPRASLLIREHASAPAHDFDSPASASASLFEPATNEYDLVPLSSLDHPYTKARTSKQALANLVSERRYADADALLADLLAAHHPPFGDPRSLRTQYLANHTLRLFKDNRASNWLSWWRITHGVPNDLRIRDWVDGTVLNTHATQFICETLARGGDHARIEEFALVAADAGHERLVARHFLVHLALYAPGDVSERVWARCIAGIEARKEVVQEEVAQDRYFAPERPNLAVKETRTARRAARNRLATRVAADEAFLRVQRAAMIRAHLTMGRLEFAAARLTDSEGGTQTAKPTYQIYLDLLASTSKADRFDLFEATLRHLEVHRHHLVLAATPSRRQQALIRANRAAEEPQTVEDAHNFFEAYRTTSPHPRTHSLSNTVLPSPPSSPSPSLSPPLATTDDALSPDEAFSRALTSGSVNTAASLFAASLGSEHVPSLHLTARFILLLRRHGPTGQQLLVALPRTLEAGGWSTVWTRRYWASASVLSHVMVGENELAIGAFTSTFELAGLPEAVRQELVAVAPVPTLEESLPLIGQNHQPLRRALAVPPHALALAMEALVPLLVSSASSPTTALNALLSTFTSPLSTFNILRSPSLPPSHSPLHPTTFTHFLTALVALRQPPISLLRILASMQQHLHLAPTKHQWGITLSSFARDAPPADTATLLRFIEGKPFEEGAVEGEVEALLMGMERPKDTFNDVVLWTTVVKGLTLQREYEAAWEVAERFQEGQQDGAWRKATKLLVKFGGQSRRSVEVPTVEMQVE